MRILVSGANGFVGRAVCRALLAANISVTGLVRRSDGCIEGVDEWVHAYPDFVNLEQAWPASLRCDAVIHVAARVHVLHEQSTNALAEFRKTNVEGTLRIAKAAAQAGVKRFVFVSSVKALGEIEPGRPWREDDASVAVDPYGVSKHEAEQALIALGRETGQEIVIVRPPLVYGPGVQANFLQLLHALARGIPLPLGGSQAARSMVFVDNLAHALVHCAKHPDACGKIFHVTDETCLLVPEFLRLLAQQLNRPARLFNLPVGLLRWLARLVGREAQVDRLFVSLRLDTARIHTMLDWTPPFSVEQGLAETATWYRATYFPNSR